MYMHADLCTENFSPAEMNVWIVDMCVWMLWVSYIHERTWTKINYVLPAVSNYVYNKRNSLYNYVYLYETRTIYI